MGEYAIYQGREVKIGTCENLYHLRWEQAHLVTPAAHSLDPIAERAVVRFRFPWPDEDGQEPGELGRGDPFRGLVVALAGADAPHYSGCTRPTSGVLRQQAWRQGHLVPVIGCPACPALWSVPERADMAPVLAALARDAEVAATYRRWEQSRWLRQVGRRILAGYDQVDVAAPLEGVR